MKARVKATGEIVDVYNLGNPTYRATDGSLYEKDVLDFDVEDENNPNYWEKLLHQYAGMAMQAYINNNVYMREIRTMCKTPNEMREMVADLSVLLATALVEKLKEEK